MSESINWIFLTDLHLGLDDRSWLWPKVKHDLFIDLAKMTDQIGGWDLVFFTGDFVQAGSRAEYDLLNKEIEGLWKVLSTFSRPFMCPVPGNHDLIRPSKGSAVLRTLTQLWWSDVELRRTFWHDDTCEERVAIKEYFREYSTWLSQLQVPTLPREEGILPGDFSSIFQKSNVELGIVGLNSSFLQLASGDFKGKLALHVSQLNAVCSANPSTWLNDRTASVLLTHQPPTWLAPDSVDHYRQEIYPPGRFISHLYGHQHEPETMEMSEAGGRPRRFRQGPSLFGLEEWAGETPIKRTHGYIAGQFVFDGVNSIETFWPRTAIRARHGGLNLCPDHSFQLNEDNSVIVPFELTTEDDDSSEDSDKSDMLNQQDAEADPIQETPGDDLHLLDKAPDLKTSRTRLASCPRLSLSSTPHHRAIRQEEQSQFELEIRRSRAVWLSSDWGMGKEEFLAAALERFRIQGNQLEVFHLLCDDADDGNSFQALFPQQFGMTMQAFCGYVTALSGAFLVFDGIHPSLSTEEHLYKLLQIIAAILDYCPELRVVVVSRTPLVKADIPLVELHSLDVPDVRTYLLQHPDATPGLCDPDIIDKLHERSDGLPMHLDRMLRSLKVSSLESVLDAEMEGPSEKDSLSESVPKALVHAVNTLVRSVDKRSKRSLRLLKVLSVLPYGETLETLAHYLPTEPFFIDNALQLNELALLDAIPLKHVSSCVNFGKNCLAEENAPKILKVPRQIGRYMLTILSDNERTEIVLAGVERFFGRRWREGKVKLRTLPFEYREYLSSGVGNEFAVVHHLIVDAKKNGDIFTARKAAKLGLQFCRRVRSEERYRDLAVIAGGMLQTVERDNMPEQWSELAMLTGIAMRMTSKHEEALRHLHGALDAGERHLGNSEKASIWLNIALAEEKLKHNDLAVKASTEVQRFASQGSAAKLHAIAIEAGLTLMGAKKRRRLIALEKQARNEGHLSLADTITLDLAYDMDKPAEEIRLLDRVLGTKQTHGYNQIRAIVAKARSVERMQGPQAKLTTSDLSALISAYSYLYAQRFGSLFDQCHATLWTLLESRGDTAQLFRLFRHSSFLWRIRGNETKEAEYLKRLSSKNPPSSDNPSSTGLLLEIRYFWRRVKLVIAA